MKLSFLFGWTDPYKTIAKFIVHSIFYGVFGSITLSNVRINVEVLNVSNIALSRSIVG